MSGSWFKELIDRAFLHNRGYDYAHNSWDRRGVWEGLGQTGLGMLNPGMGILGGKLIDRYNSSHPGAGYNGNPFGGNSGFGGFGATGGYQSTPGGSNFGGMPSGYGTGSTLGNNTDAFGLPVDPGQLGHGGGGGTATAGSGHLGATSGPLGGGGGFGGARFSWGVNVGPDYS